MDIQIIKLGRLPTVGAVVVCGFKKKKITLAT